MPLPFAAVVALLSMRSRYFERLGMDPTTLDPKPTVDKLRIIQEAHLAAVPFENLAQHGATGGPAIITDTNVLVDKILTKKRGGFCFEVNGLLAALLEDLDYQVKRVPAKVFVPDVSYREHATHMILLVKTVDDSTWFVDVGFGEPSIHPLQYEFQTVQETPDLMQSRIMPTKVDTVELQWRMGTVWVPRLQWKVSDTSFDEPGPTMADFSSALSRVQEPSSIFSQKLICCKVTCDEKLTLAGNKLKCTGPPRFAIGGVTPTVRELSNVDEVRQVLEDKFGIPLSETEGLDLAPSLQAPPEVWSSM